MRTAVMTKFLRQVHAKIHTEEPFTHNDAKQMQRCTQTYNSQAQQPSLTTLSVCLSHTNPHTPGKSHVCQLHCLVLPLKLVSERGPSQSRHAAGEKERVKKSGRATKPVLNAVLHMNSMASQMVTWHE